MSNPRSCHQAAREYLALGLHPIPCAPRSKRPLVEWRRYQKVSPLPEELDVWWRDSPDANVALVLGRGTFAVDLDGGPYAERLLHAQGITLPSAPMSRTANGYHVFLSATGPIPDRVGLLKGPTGQPRPPAVDVRGIGIVVAPPSIHPTGAVYEWILPLFLPFPPAPPELLALIRAGSVAADSGLGPAGGAGWVGEALRGVPEGARDATCTRLAGYFLGRGLDVQIVETLLTEGFALRCVPHFSPLDVRKCVQSVARREGLHGMDLRITPTPLANVLEHLTGTLGSPPPLVIPTPFPSLNHYLSGGFGLGELIYLGARPAVGKTSLGLEIARSAARAGQSVLFVSREMVTLALARRILAQETRISASALKLGRLTDADEITLHEHLPQLKTLPIWLTDEAISIREITDLVTLAERPFGLLIVDYLQLVRAPLDVKDRRLQVEAVSQALKTLAVRCQIPVLCLSSLARPPAESKDKPPTLASLRESGELEHDADIVLLLHRPKGRAETACEVAKNRDGRTGTLMLTFRPDYVSFDELSDRI